MYFQSIVMNVADIDRSLEFYSEVLGFKLLSRKDQLAAIHAPSDRPQVIVLRALGASSSRVGGARHVGIRALVLEVESLDELERIASEMDRRQCMVARREGDTWRAAFGRDPDHTAVVAGSSRTPQQSITLEAWANLDEFLYGVGE
jgi:catechol 2,3-dioxygenase-like lactoylglutathione lyase family enzyme